MLKFEMHGVIVEFGVEGGEITGGKLRKRRSKLIFVLMVLLIHMRHEESEDPMQITEQY